MPHPTTPFLLLLAFVALLALANLLVSLYALHKVRRVHLKLFDLAQDSVRLGERMFRQVQALDGLYREPGFERALPPTRGWAASPDFLWILARHALEHRPETVVECGSGVSTLVLARCLQKNGSGRVVSLDHDAQFAEETRRNLARHGLSDWAQVIDAPLRAGEIGGRTFTWYAREKVPDMDRIDMLVVDGPPTPMDPMMRYPAGPLLLAKLAPGGALFMDDADRPEERRIVELWLAENPGLRAERMECEKGCVAMRREAE